MSAKPEQALAEATEPSPAPAAEESKSTTMAEAPVESAPAPVVEEPKPTTTAEIPAEPVPAPAVEESKATTTAEVSAEAAPAPAVEESEATKTAEAAAESAPAPAPVVEESEATKTAEAAAESAPAPAPVVEESKPATTAQVPAESTPAPAPAPAVEEPQPTAAEVPSEAAAPAKPEKSVEPSATTPLSKLFAELPSIIKEADYREMWGVDLTDDTHVPSAIILEKFLRANNKDVVKAKAQLLEALKWRKRVQPIQLLEAEFDPAKFGGLGYVTIYPKSDTHSKEIVTWNIYGAVKDNKATFGNVEEFVKWRAALMELSVKELDLASATEKIPENGPDPYRMIQVHDYLNVSFLRMDPTIRAASKETIQIFSMAYPELLKEKFFVNVPLVMGWVFSAMKIFLSPETVKKFHPLSYGSNLAGELKSFGQELPAVYGGKGKDVKDGMTVKYAAADAAEGQ